MKIVRLDDGEAIVLSMFLTMTTRYRQEEAAACRRLSEERDADGTPKFPKMAANAAWWERADKMLEAIRDRVDAAPREGVSE